MKLVKYFFLLLSLWCGAFLPAGAGTLVKALGQSYTAKNQYGYLTFSINQGQMRIDNQGPGSNSSILYDRKNSSFLFLDHKDKTSLEVTPAEQAQLKILILLMAKGMGMDLQKKKNRKQLEEFNLSQQYIRDFFTQTSSPRPPDATIAGFPCQRYEADDHGNKYFEFWAVPQPRTLMAPEDFETYLSFLDMPLNVLGNMLALYGVDLAQFKRQPIYRDIPIVSIFHEKGKPSAIFRVLSITPHSFATGIFTPPSGYKKQSATEIFTKGLSQAATLLNHPEATP